MARRFRVEHEYVFLDDAPRDGAAALRRFVEVGEGGTDEFAAYLDGCAMWSGFFARNLCGIIRGDDPIGVRRRAASDASARTDGVGAMVADYPEGHLVRRLGLADQSLPERLERRSGEGAEAYRDRMSHDGYIPVGLAPLTAIKCRYVEVVNPLLSRRIVDPGPHAPRRAAHVRARPLGDRRPREPRHPSRPVHLDAAGRPCTWPTSRSSGPSWPS